MRPVKQDSQSAEENCMTEIVALLCFANMATLLAQLKGLSPVDLQSATLKKQI